MYLCWTSDTCTFILVVGAQNPSISFGFPPSSPQKSARALVSACKCLWCRQHRCAEKKRVYPLVLLVENRFLYYFVTASTDSLDSGYVPHLTGPLLAAGACKRLWRGTGLPSSLALRSAVGDAAFNEREMFLSLVWESVGSVTSCAKRNCIWFNH